MHYNFKSIFNRLTGKSLPANRHDQPDKQPAMIYDRDGRPLQFLQEKLPQSAQGLAPCLADMLNRFADKRLKLEGAG